MRLRANAGILVQAAQADGHERRAIGADGVRVWLPQSTQNAFSQPSPGSHTRTLSSPAVTENAPAGQSAVIERGRARSALTALAVAEEGAGERRGARNLHSATHASSRQRCEVAAHDGSHRFPTLVEALGCIREAA
jgi:hypothetical protein